MSDHDTIQLKLWEPHALGYLALLESQTNDVGFQDDAKWLRKEMEDRGWIGGRTEDTNADN